MKALQFIDGYKTYLLGLGIIILWLGIQFDVWTLNDVDVLMGMMSGLGLLSLRHSVKKLER